jgi:hypothetical protein
LPVFVDKSGFVLEGLLEIGNGGVIIMSDNDEGLVIST